MEVQLAKTAGFCFGVKRAVKTVNDEVEKNTGGRLFTYGPIIHNADVIREFEGKGVYAVHSLDEMLDAEESTSENVTMIIRAHGVPEMTIRAAEEKGIRVVDATCPFVKKIHEIVREKSEQGETIVVVGDAKHPEVKGICGWVKGPYYVVSTLDEASQLPQFDEQPVTVVFQTTFDTVIYKEYVEIITKKGYSINVMNTICNATAERQNEAALIAKSVDVMLVVGDKASANTNRLYDICKTYCKDTYYIQNKDDLETVNLQSQSGISVGITAGASTPEKIIQEVFFHVRRKKF